MKGRRSAGVRLSLSGLLQQVLCHPCEALFGRKPDMIDTFVALNTGGMAGNALPRLVYVERDPETQARVDVQVPWQHTWLGEKPYTQ